MPDLTTTLAAYTSSQKVTLFGAAVGATDLVDVAGLVGDGVTDNRTALENYFRVNARAKTINPSFPKSVTISGTPALFALEDHRFRVNEAVQFVAPAPTGLSANTVYYVISSGLTQNTFKLSTTNAFTLLDGEGSAVNASGSGTLVTLGAEWQNYVIAPGNYYLSQNTVVGGNAKRQRYFAYGAAFNNISFSAWHVSLSYNYDDRGSLQAYFKTVAAGSQFVQLVDIANASKFAVGGIVLLSSIDLQNSYGTQQSTPNNPYYFEYIRIADISGDILTFETKLKNSYKSTYPELFAGGPHQMSGGGPATVFVVSADWDAEREVYGIRYTSGSGAGLNLGMRRAKYVDCVFDFDGGIPTINQEFIAINCEWGEGRAEGSGSQVEVDKLCEYVALINCRAPKLLVQSSNAFMLVEGGRYNAIEGTARNTILRGINTNSLTLGPAFFGYTDSLLIEGSYIGNIDEVLRLDDQLVSASAKFRNCVSNFTFVNGVLKVPHALAPNSWAIPGRRMYINDMAGTFSNMGSPFIITDVFDDGTNFCIETTLTALPVGNSTSNTVTMTSASPAVFTWAGHGLPANAPVRLKTTGALYTGLSTQALYYVAAAGLTTDTFRLIDGNGNPVNTSGSQSGTHTAVANPLHFKAQSVGSLTVRNCWGCAAIVDMSNAPGGLPPFSYFKKRIFGPVEGHPFWTDPKIFGKITRLGINVVRPYTGTGSMTMTLTANAFNGSLLAANLSQIVNVKIAGERVVTQTAATGGQSGDTIAAFANWISDTVELSTSTFPSAPIDQWPIVEIEMLTDQGLTLSMPMVTAGLTNSDHNGFISGTQVGR